MINPPAEVKDGLSTTSAFVVKKYNVGGCRNSSVQWKHGFLQQWGQKTKTSLVSSCVELLPKPNTFNLYIWPTLYESVDDRKRNERVKGCTYVENVALLWLQKGNYILWQYDKQIFMPPHFVKGVQIQVERCLDVQGKIWLTS